MTAALVLETALWPPGITPLTPPAPCRYCHVTAHLTDADGPLHTCCQAHAGRIANGWGCPSCRASERAAARDYDYTAVDRAAIASGKRRSNLAQYRNAQQEAAR